MPEQVDPVLLAPREHAVDDVDPDVLVLLQRVGGGEQEGGAEQIPLQLKPGVGRGMLNTLRMTALPALTRIETRISHEIHLPINSLYDRLLWKEREALPWFLPPGSLRIATVPLYSANTVGKPMTTGRGEVNSDFWTTLRQTSAGVTAGHVFLFRFSTSKATRNGEDPRRRAIRGEIAGPQALRSCRRRHGAERRPDRERSRPRPSTNSTFSPKTGPCRS
jgi:hypothetical protein